MEVFPQGVVRWWVLPRSQRDPHYWLHLIDVQNPKKVKTASHVASPNARVMTQLVTFDHRRLRNSSHQSHIPVT